MVQELKIPKNRKEAFNILGLQGSENTEEVRKAYKKHALKWHPDKWPDESEEEKHKVMENFKAVTIAHRILIGEITEEFISQQTNDDWIGKFSKEFRYSLLKDLYGTHLNNEELDLFDALNKKDLEKTKSLLEKIKNINVQSKFLNTYSDQAPLHYIVKNACEEHNNGWIKLLEEVLSKYSSSSLTAAHASININIQNHFAYTPLHAACKSVACKSLCLNVISLLFKHGADPNILNYFNNTSLDDALQNNRDDIAELLIENGASIKRSINCYLDKYNKRTLRVLIEYTSSEQKTHMLHTICLRGPETDDKIKFAGLLLHLGADPEFCDKTRIGTTMFYSALSWSYSSGQVKLQELLKKYKKQTPKSDEVNNGISPRGRAVIGIDMITCALALYFLTPLILGASVELGTKLALGAAGAVIGGGVGYLRNIVIDKFCGNEVTLDAHMRCST